MTVIGNSGTREGMASWFNRATFGALLNCLAVIVLLSISAQFAEAAQTREECDRCCERQGYDDYFTEQCKLKCFRDPSHCGGGTSIKSAKPKKKKATKKKRKRRQRITLRFPSPLNITPGEEWKSAVEICVINGITSSNRNFAAAVQGVEQILIDFAKNNPSGGNLPTTKLERIIVRYK